MILDHLYFTSFIITILKPSLCLHHRFACYSEVTEVSEVCCALWKKVWGNQFHMCHILTGQVCLLFYLKLILYVLSWLLGTIAIKFRLIALLPQCIYWSPDSHQLQHRPLPPSEWTKHCSLIHQETHCTTSDSYSVIQSLILVHKSRKHTLSHRH